MNSKTNVSKDISKKNKKNKQVKTCAIYGIFDCECCNINNVKETEMINDKSNVSTIAKDTNITDKLEQISVQIDSALDNVPQNEDEININEIEELPERNITEISDIQSMDSSNISENLIGPEINCQDQIGISNETNNINNKMSSYSLDAPSTSKFNQKSMLFHSDNDDNNLIDKKPVSENVLNFVDSVTADIKLEENLDDYEQRFIEMIENEIKKEESTSELPIQTIKLEIAEEPQTSEDTRPTASILSDACINNEEEEIDVVNLPDEQTNILTANGLFNNISHIAVNSSVNNNPESECSNQNKLAQNNNANENSDDEDSIIDILNCDDTENQQANLIENLERNKVNMEPANVNEDEIIDVENLTDDSSDRFCSPNHFVKHNFLRKRLLKRKNKYLLPNKRRRMNQTVMTIDLINSPRDNNIIEIPDSLNSPKQVTEIINLVDDDNAEPTEDSVLNITPVLKHAGYLGDCPVCLESLLKKEIMSTICGHVFCSRCIKNVIKTTKKCPNCRKKLTLKSIHPLFI